MIEKSDILLDSCIINHLLSKDKKLSKQAAELIEALAKNHNRLSISQFTLYEIFRGQNDSQRKKAEKELENFIVIDHTQLRQQRATALFSAYKKVRDIKQRMDSISDCDIFIGSLIFTERKPLLLTCDFHDFPRPFFREVDITKIENKSGKKEICYFFQADLETFLEG